jgi:hypothetical protein
MNHLAEAFQYEDGVRVVSAAAPILVNDSPGDGFLVTGVTSPTYKWPVAATSQVTAFGINLAPNTETPQDVTSPPTTLEASECISWIGVVPQWAICSHSHRPSGALSYVSPSQIQL